MAEHRSAEHRLVEHRLAEHRLVEHRLVEHRLVEHRLVEHRLAHHARLALKNRTIWFQISPSRLMIRKNSLYGRTLKLGPPSMELS